MWSCAWIPAEERSGSAPAPVSYSGEKPDLCPGYLIQLPQVGEAVRAFTWRKDGALREFYDGRPITPLAKFAIDTFAGAQREVENYNIRNPKESG